MKSSAENEHNSPDGAVPESNHYQKQSVRNEKRLPENRQPSIFLGSSGKRTRYVPKKLPDLLTG
jgi:hypothetical protein